MSRVTVSATRFRSMLANRRVAVEDVRGVVTTFVDLRLLTERDTDVDFDDLQVLAKYFKKPWSYLLSDEEEKFPELGQGNRTFANRKVPVSLDLMAEYEAASLMLDAVVELFPEESVQVPTARLTIDVPAPRAAAVIRAFLEVSLEQQLASKDDYAALRLWVEALQRAGVYVSQRRLRDKTIRAFSKLRDRQALVVVSTADTPYARIFSVLHEYCHIVLRSTGICDLDDHSALESYCNEVAAAVLLPEELLVGELANVAFGDSPEADDERLIRLSRRFHVSQAALLIRLRQRGAMSEELFEGLEGRRQSRRPGRAGKGGDYYATAINRVGRRFARNVFGAVSDGALDRQDAGVLLEVGEHVVDRFRTELFEGGSGVT